jgi:Golgi nucleoside diphosphatase
MRVILGDPSSSLIEQMPREYPEIETEIQRYRTWTVKLQSDMKMFCDPRENGQVAMDCPIFQDALARFAGM